MVSATMDGFCDTPFWDTNVTWNVDNPDLTPCFQETALIWTPCLAFWIISCVEIYAISSTKGYPNPWTFKLSSKAFLLVLLIFTTAVELTIRIVHYEKGQIGKAGITGSSVLLASLCMAFVSLLFARKKGYRSPIALPVFWLVLSISSAAQFYSDVRAIQNKIPVEVDHICRMFIFLFSVLQFLLSFLSDDSADYSSLNDTDDSMSCVLKDWAFFPNIVFAYLNRIIKQGYRHDLDMSGLTCLCSDVKCSTVTKVFERVSVKHCSRCKRVFVPEENSISSVNHVENLQRRQPKKLPLYTVLLRLSFQKLFISSILEIISIAVSFGPALMLNCLLDFLANDESQWHGYVYAFVYGFSGLLFGLADTHSLYFSCFGAYQAQSALTSALYKKVFKISNASRKEYTAGEIMNMMSVDIKEVSDFLTYFSQFWSVPIRISLTLALMWQYLGVSCLASLVVMFVVSGISTFVARTCDVLQQKQMAQKDERLRQMNEILNGIKVLKLYAWEPPFIKRVYKTRQKELRYLRTYSILESTFGFLWGAAPYVAALACFSTYILIDSSHVLTPQTAFVCLSLFMLLRFPMGVLPDLISRFIRSRVSLERLQKFLNEDELDFSVVGDSPKEGQDVTIENGTFSWSSGENSVLKNINLNVKSGSLVAVVGQVGSGKSSLLSALLGMLCKETGSLDVKGSIAYVPQQAWIQNASLKKNILFVSDLDEDWYSKVISACALQPDLDILPGGDSTEIGEKGINLSGGQKQRVSLARAVYQDHDICLLDDPLSAVDAHVASHLFEHVIGPTGLLKNKTRILVTHGVTFLPEVDHVIVLKKGQIVEQGSYKELLEKNGDFALFLKKHLKDSGDASSIKSKESDESPEEKEEDKKENKNELTEEEHYEVGRVGFKVYSEVLRRIGWRYIIPSLMCIVVFSGSEFGSGLILSKWSSLATQGSSTQKTYLMYYGLVLLAYSITSFLNWTIFMIGAVNASISFHQDLLHKIMRAPLSFFDITPMGRIINRFSRDIESIDTEIPIFLLFTATNLIWTLFLFIVLFVTSWYFVIIIFVATPVFVLIAVTSVSAYRHVHRLESISRSPLFSHFSETISGTVSVRAYGVVEKFVRKLFTHVDNNINAVYHVMALNRWQDVYSQIIASLISFVAASLAVSNRDAARAGIVGLALSYVVELSGALSWTFRNLCQLETALVAVERVKEYFNIEQEAPWEIEDHKPSQSWPSQGSITYSDYSTIYREGLEPVLHHVNFTFNSGEKVGIVGRTGAGKSSLALSLFRIIEPTTGSITVDELNIGDIGLHSLRSKLTVIPQDPVLFAGSLRWNIDPWDEHSDDEIWNALELSHLKEFISGLDKGLEHEVTEGGDNLSAGQRQLLCLTRALLRHSRILVLDEATAAVDLETDKLIQDTIRKEFKSSTIVTIAHRLHTIMDYDRILVLSAGKILESGSPEDLLRNQESSFFCMARDAGLV